MIGGANYKHFVYDDLTHTFDHLHCNVDALDLCTPGIIKVGNEVLMFGEIHAGECKNKVHQYDIIDNKWTEKKIAMPITLVLFGCTIVLNEQYALLFGGYGGESQELQDGIWIYSVQNKEFRKSRIICPQKGPCDVFTARDKVKDTLAMFGFVRDVWTKEGINEQLFPPQYLIRNMNRYYTNEWIHCFRQRKHWKINVIDIIE